METSQERGHPEKVDPNPNPSRQRGKSKDFISNFDSRLSRLEERVSAQSDELDHRVDELETEVSETHTVAKAMLLQMEESLRAEMGKIREEFEGELAKTRHVFQTEVNGTLVRLDEVQADLARCKRAMVARTGSSVVESQRIDIPRPKSFGGSRKAQEVDNFLWGLDKYFGAVGVTEESSRIETAVLYLTDTARLWWRRREGDIEKGICTISTFNDFKRELKRQFYPENAEDEARARLRRIKQTGTIRDYIKDFTDLIVEIPKMSDKDSLFNFMDGLQSWVKTELRRRGVQDLATAIAVAESLIDYSTKKEYTGKSKDKKGSFVKGVGDMGQSKESNRDTRQDFSSSKGKDKGKH